MKLITIILLTALFCANNCVSQNVLSQKALWSAIGTTHLVNSKNNEKIVLSKNTAFVFLSPECPLCKNYMLVLNNLVKAYPQVNIVGIIPGKSYTAKVIKEFGIEYQAQFNLYLDQDKALTKLLLAKTTPETVLLDQLGNIRYRGLIDNWQATLGVKRKVITDHYLENALKKITSKNYTYTETNPIGCRINDL